MVVSLIGQDVYLELARVSKTFQLIVFIMILESNLSRIYNVGAYKQKRNTKN